MKKAKNGHGTFIISLDFELLWGVRDHETKESFGQQAAGARRAVTEMLKLFDQHQIHATWGIVGMLMAKDKAQMLRYSPSVKPQYENQKLSAYQYMDQVGDGEESDHCHYAYSLVGEIAQHPHQEVASHTYSHYYCKAPGQNIQAFQEDLCAARKIAKENFGIELKSLILPQNQFVDAYMQAAYEAGFLVIRGNPESFAYNTSTKKARIMRFLDTYVGVCGRKTYHWESPYVNGMVNVKASSFFRKYNTKLSFLEKFKVSHIKREMKYAAKKGQIYHLWWHPHNVGTNMEQCFAQLEEILSYYNRLQLQYGFESKNMFEAAEAYLK